MFYRMEPMQVAAVETLEASDYLSKSHLVVGEVESTAKKLTEGLGTRIAELNDRDAALLEFFGVLLADYSLFGKDGLKDRTGLLEYRYDAI
jgi:hypothetical protein